MKKIFNYKVILPIDWILFFVHTFFMNKLRRVLLPDFSIILNEYHYGPCSFSITIFFSLMLIGLMYLFFCVRVGGKEILSKIRIYEIICILIIFFVTQVLFFLNYYSLYLLLDHRLHMGEIIFILFAGFVISIIPIFQDRV